MKVLKNVTLLTITFLATFSVVKPTVFDNLKELTHGNNDFACELYQNLKGQSGNLFFSPLSISSALAMTYAGARNKTEEEMAKTFHFTLGQKALHPTFGALINSLNKEGQGGNYELNIANALWMQDGYSFRNKFLNLNKKNYSTKLNIVNFRTKPEIAVKTINNWVSDKTKNKIPSIISLEDIDDLTRLVITNAIYFKGKWAKQFKKSSTLQNHSFYSRTKEVKVPMMYQEGKFNYTETDDCQIVELLYKGNDIRMLILLPKEKFGLSKIEQQLSIENLSSWLSKIHPEEIQLYLPKFKTTFEVSLPTTLIKMGMTEAFDGRADFSGITKYPELYISDVIHKAFVEIDEEGTEATAATAVILGEKSIPLHIKNPIIFCADHPFIFLIQSSNGEILFMGKITDPTIEENIYSQIPTACPEAELS